MLTFFAGHSKRFILSHAKFNIIGALNSPRKFTRVDLFLEEFCYNLKHVRNLANSRELPFLIVCI
jgi:hypothetical protein